MSDFQPLGCGFGRSILPPATPADPPTSEPMAMAKKDETTQETILRLIGEAGGEMSGADLRDRLDVDDAERRAAISGLRHAGKISSTGATVNIVYSLSEAGVATEPRHRIPNAAKPAKSAKQVKSKPTSKALATTTTAPQPFDQFDYAEQKANGLVPARPPASVSIAVAIVSAPLQDQHQVSIEAAFLRRVLRPALGAPGDICDADRQALHAIAVAA